VKPEEVRSVSLFVRYFRDFILIGKCKSPIGRGLGMMTCVREKKIILIKPARGVVVDDE